VCVILCDLAHGVGMECRLFYPWRTSQDNVDLRERVDEAGGAFWSVDARGADGSGRSGRAGEVRGGLFWCGMACGGGGAFEMLGHALERWPVRDLFGPRW
jgi:hypothetical protein